MPSNVQTLPASFAPPAPGNLGNEQRYAFILRWYRGELPDSYVQASLAITDSFEEITSRLRVKGTVHLIDDDSSDVLERRFELRGQKGYLPDFSHAIRTITETITRNPDWRRSDVRSTRKIVGQPIAGILRGSRAHAARRDSKTASVWELTAARLRPGKNGRYVSEHVFFSHNREEMQKAAWELKDHIHKQMRGRWRLWGHKDTLSIGVNEYLREASRKGFFVRLEHASSLALLEATGYALAYMSRPSKAREWRGNLDAFDRYVIRYSRKSPSEVGSASVGTSRRSMSTSPQQGQDSHGNQRNRSSAREGRDRQLRNRYVEDWQREDAYQHGSSGAREDPFPQSSKPRAGLFAFHTRKAKERTSLQEQRLQRASGVQGGTRGGAFASMWARLTIKKQPKMPGKMWEESRKRRPKIVRMIRRKLPGVEQASSYRYSDYASSQT